MTTTYESADLILKLYDLRREEKMRESRSWWFGFNPKSMADVQAVYMGPDSAKMRQSAGYWDMAAALVNNGAIDEQMFVDTNGEYWFVFIKLQPFLDEIRKMQPNFLVQLEKFIMRQPHAQQTIDAMRKQWVK